VDALGQPWDQLSAQDQLALVRAWPLGHPAELSERLIQLLQADPSTWDLLLPGLATASERELLMLLDAIEATAPLAGIAPLLTRAANERPGPLRRRISDVLYIYSPEQLAPELDKALSNPKQQVLARELLLAQGTPGSRAQLAQALELASNKPYAWDCKAEFFCQDGPDQDQDGWPDAFETQLGTDPTNADSDGDGLTDAQDPCPMTAVHAAPDPSGLWISRPPWRSPGRRRHPGRGQLRDRPPPGNRLRSTAHLGRRTMGAGAGQTSLVKLSCTRSLLTCFFSWPPLALQQIAPLHRTTPMATLWEPLMPRTWP